MDLGFLRFVSAIGTQGAISQETKLSYYITSYKVDVSSNGEDWITLKEGSKQKVRMRHLLLLLLLHLLLLLLFLLLLCCWKSS